MRLIHIILLRSILFLAFVDFTNHNLQAAPTWDAQTPANQNMKIAFNWSGDPPDGEDCTFDAHQTNPQTAPELLPGNILDCKSITFNAGSATYTLDIRGDMQIRNFVSNQSGVTQTFNINRNIATLLIDSGPNSDTTTGAQINYHSIVTGADITVRGNSLGLFGNFIIDAGTTLHLDTSGATTVQLAGLTTDSGSSVIMNDGNVQIGILNSNTTVAGVISDAGPSSGLLIKEGTGTLLFNAVNTYGKGTSITNGILQAGVANTITASGSLTVGATGTFNLNNLNNQVNNLSGAAGGQVTMGTGNLIINQTTGSLVFAGLISGSGDVSKIGGSDITFSGVNSYTGDTVITAGSIIAGVIDTIKSSPSVTLNGTSTFDITGFDNQIKTLNGDPGTNILLGGNILTVNQLVDGTFSGIISDSGSGGKLVKIGSARLTLAGANNYIGGTTITAGTLQGTTTSLQGDIADNAILMFNQAGSGTYAGLLTGTGIVKIDGGGTVNFGQTEQYTGATTITSGTLQAGAVDIIKTSSSLFIDTTGHFDLNGFDNQITSLSGAVAPAAPSSILLGGNKLTVNQLVNGTFDGVITGSATGQLVKIGPAKLTITGANSFGGGTTINAGTLEGNTTSLQDPILDNAALIINQSFNGNYTGVISGSGSLEKNGSGIVTITQQQAYLGPTTITNGTLKDGSILGNIFINSSALAVNTTGTFDLNNHNNQVNNLSGNGGNITLGSGTFTVNNTAPTIFAGAITSVTGGGLTLIGGGTLTLTGSNSYNGPTTITNGILSAGATNTLSSSSNVSIGASGTLALTTFPNLIGSLSGVTGSKVTLGSSVLTVAGTGPTSFQGIISGTGAGNGFTYNGTGTMTLSGLNTYTGTTIINNGILQAGIANTIQSSGSVTLNAGAFDLNNFNNTLNNLSGNAGTSIALGSGILTINQQATSTFAGIISSTTPGNQLIKTGNGTLILSSVNTYNGPTSINAGTLQAGVVNTIAASSAVNIGSQGIFKLNDFNQQINNLTADTGAQIQLGASSATNLTVVQNTNGTFNGIISGAGALFKNGNATLFLTTSNTYTGGTAVFAGNLQGNTASLINNIVVFSGGTLTFDQTTNGTFNGQLFSNGNVVKQGIGTLTYNTDQSTFTGLTAVTQGGLIVDTTLGGNVTLSNATFLDIEGTITGNVTSNSSSLVFGKGTIGGDLNLFPESTIRPSDPFQTITIGGNFTSQANSNYIVHANFTGSNTRLDIGGIAFLAGNVTVETINSNLNTAIPYTILHANGGINGQFANVFISTGGLIIPTLSYDTNNVYLRLTSNLVIASVTGNELHVAQQLDSITNPTPDEAIVLNILVNGTREEARSAMNAMSGEQYTYLPTTNIYSSERFTQKIYNALRTINTPCWCLDPRATLQPWFQFEGSNCSAMGDRNSQSMTNSLLNMSFGANIPYSRRVIFGGAASYEKDNIQFHQGGRTVWNIWQGSLYTLLRTKKLYLFADATIGAGWGEFRRHIQFDVVNRTAKSNPKSRHAYFYTEAGYTFSCNHLLVQPFVAGAYGIYNQQTTTEKGANSLNLKIFGKTNTCPSSYIGTHLSTSIGYSVDLSCDLAWQHRFGSNHYTITNQFTDFGQKFGIMGSRIGNDAAEITLNASVSVRDRLTLYVQFAGERWVGWSAYGIDLGISYWW